MINRRVLIVAALAFTLILFWSTLALPAGTSGAWQSAKDKISQIGGSKDTSGSSSNPPKSPPSGPLATTEAFDRSHIHDYFEQVFSVDEPEQYEFEHLRRACDEADWDANEAYINCVGINAGMTSVMSQVKVCLKMAVDTGTHLMLPNMPLRSSDDLQDFNFLNSDAYMPYDEWFDVDHLRRQLGRACPRMKVLHPKETYGNVTVRRHWTISCADALNYRKMFSYFWVGRPFKTFFAKEFAKHEAEDAEKAKITPEDPNLAQGITIIDTDSEFLAFRITDDPTHRELLLWNDLSHLVRFRADVRNMVDVLLRRLPQPSHFMGVHFRAENDSIWSTAEHQMHVDLDALDQAWAHLSLGFGGKKEKPPVYIACGDAHQVEMFIQAGKERGWDVTDKYLLANVDGDTETGPAINAMPFDFQGAIDMGLMVRSLFFIGVQGSAFSSTIGNQRDATGRYRGSSFDVYDAGARTHLFNDMDANEYACCL